MTKQVFIRECKDCGSGIWRDGDKNRKCWNAIKYCDRCAKRRAIERKKHLKKRKDAGQPKSVKDWKRKLKI